METWEKALKLEQFIRNYIPRGWREPIHVPSFVPSVTSDNYTFFETSFKQGTLDADLLNYSDCSFLDNHKPIKRFKDWYIIEAIKEYFEKDSLEIRERKCEYCGAITKRTSMGLCSNCCKFDGKG